MERLKALQARIHDLFVRLVKTRRGTKLQIDHPDLFTGAFWVGAEAMELGLVDGLGDIRSVLRERFGDKVQIRIIPPTRPSLLARLFSRRSFGPESLIDPDRGSRHGRGAGGLGSARAVAALRLT